jgi:hypothetical protein
MIHMSEPDRFAAIRKAFEARGLNDLCLTAMVRIVFDEWLKSQTAKGGRGR